MSLDNETIQIEMIQPTLIIGTLTKLLSELKRVNMFLPLSFSANLFMFVPVVSMTAYVST